MNGKGVPAVRYSFAGFTVSTARRVLSRSGRELPLIPRYFDLLVLLLRRRNEAVHRSEIMETVWSDVVVSDGALSQAIRTLRRTLGDDSREPVFIRTVSRHGYRFVHPDVIEEPDVARAAGPAASSSESPPAVEPAAAPAAPAAPAVQPSTMPAAPPPYSGPIGSAGPTGRTEASAASATGGASAADPFEPLLARLLGSGAGNSSDPEADRREAAESLHALGTAEALRRLEGRPGQERARAILRDSRWDVPGAGPVPLIDQPRALASIRAVAWLRLRRAARVTAARWSAASGGGAASGFAAGLMGGMVMYAASGGSMGARVPVVFAIVAAVIGGVGAAGVGAGLAVAEALARSYRGSALVVLGAAGGGAVGLAAHTVGRWALEGIFGHDISQVGGAFEGVALGAAAGLGYALTTPRHGGGMAAPRGSARFVSALVTGVCCALAGVAITALGGHMGGVSLDYMARSFQGSQVGLAPLARLFGESELGPVTRFFLSVYEGLLFGFGLVMGLTRRPRIRST